MTGYVGCSWGVHAPRVVTPHLPFEASLKGLDSPPASHAEETSPGAIALGRHALHPLSLTSLGCHTDQVLSPAWACEAWEGQGPISRSFCVILSPSLKE